MSEMHPWDGRVSPGGRPPGTPRARGDSPPPRTPPAAPAPQATEAVRAVQVALDRRDNGGDAVGAAGEPTAGRTRQ